MAGTIIADYIRADANKISLNVGNTVIASVNSLGILSNTGAVMISSSGQVPNTVISGTITQSQIGTNVVGTGPAFSATLASQSVSSSIWTKLQFNTEQFDTNNNFDNATNYRFTPTIAGYYLICLSATHGTSANPILANIYKNGSGYQIVSAVGLSSVYDPTACVSTIIYFNGTTDYVEGYMIANANVTASGRFSGSLVRAA